MVTTERVRAELMAHAPFAQMAPDDVDRFLAAARTGRRADDADLLIGVVDPEAGQVDAQAVFKAAPLDADFIGVGGFRVEGLAGCL